MRTPLGLLGINVGHLWHAIVGVALGGINWTIATAGKFVLNTLAGIVKLLIPTSWIHAGVRVMQWLVSVPDYSARIAGPNGTHVYGFAGINDLRALMTWVAIAVLPLSLTIGAGRGLIGKDHPALPIARTVCVAGVVIFYGTLWSQGAALANQLTHLILGLPAVTHGIQNLFTLVLGGGVLSGFAFIGVIVTGATAAGLMAFVFVKVVVILAGAVVYAIGPLMIGLAPTRAGEALARTWASAAIALIALPVAWAFVFATAALLMYDSFTGAAGLVGSSSTLGQLLGGLSLALAGIAGFYLNIKLTRAVAALLGGQLIAMLAVVRAETHGGARSATGASGAGARAGRRQRLAAGVRRAGSGRHARSRRRPGRRRPCRRRRVGRRHAGSRGPPRRRRRGQPPSHGCRRRQPPGPRDRWHARGRARDTRRARRPRWLAERQHRRRQPRRVRPSGGRHAGARRRGRQRRRARRQADERHSEQLARHRCRNATRPRATDDRHASGRDHPGLPSPRRRRGAERQRAARRPADTHARRSRAIKLTTRRGRHELCTHRHARRRDIAGQRPDQHRRRVFPEALGVDEQHPRDPPGAARADHASGGAEPRVRHASAPTPRRRPPRRDQGGAR